MAAARTKPLTGTDHFSKGYDPTPDPLANEPIPLDAIRDLLGIARALYVVRLEQHATPAELAKIRLADSPSPQRSRPSRSVASDQRCTRARGNRQRGVRS